MACIKLAKSLKEIRYQVGGNAWAAILYEEAGD
jgi:hypothetical protein